MEEDSVELYHFCLTQLVKINDKLEPLYNESNNLFEPKIGIYKIFRKLLNNLQFLYDTNEQSSQQIVMSLGRMIVDHYSIFFLLSSHSNRKEQALRYYLYLNDSLEGRVETITKFSKEVKNTPAEILLENNTSNKNDRQAIQTISEIIQKYQLYNLVESKIIEKNNWKFSSSPPAKNKRFYTWEELYNIAKIPTHFSETIQNHFSKFTHGLGITILYSEDNPNATKYIYHFLVVIQSLIGKILLKNYPKELEDLQLHPSFLELGELSWDNWK